MNNEIELVQNLLAGLSNQNNEERKKNENQLVELIKQNTLGLSLCLSNILTKLDSNNVILTYCAVFLRKLLKAKDSETVNPHWKEGTNEMKESIKSNVLNALVNCQDKSLKKKIADVISALCESIYNNKEKWDNVYNYVATFFQTELKDENLLNIETAVYLLSKIFRYNQKELLKGVDVLINSFNNFFKNGNILIKTNSVEAICEILTDYSDKKVTKKFKVFIFEILSTVLYCLNNNDLDNLKITLFSLSELAQIQPGMLKKYFSDIFILVGKIAEKDSLDEENLRSVAFEILFSIIEKYPKVISGDEEKLSNLITGIFKYGMEFNNEIDEDWLTPKSASLEEEDFIPEEKLDEALSLIDRLILSVKPKVALKLVSNNIWELLKHSNENWKYKYMGYISIGKINEHVDELSQLEQIFNQILTDISNENPKIRYSCLFCIAQFSDSFKEEFANSYYKSVIPAILNLENNETSLRVKLQGYDSLQSFIEFCKEEQISPYIQNILDSLFFNFIKNDQECPQILRETVLDSLGELISISGPSFKQYSEKCFSMLYEYLNKDNKRINPNISLFGLLIDILTQVGENCPEILKNNCKDVVNSLIYIQNNIQNFKGDFSELFVSAWQRLLPIVKENYPDLIEPIFSSIFNVLQKPPEVSVSSNPTQKINIQDFLGNVTSSDKEGVQVERTKFMMITSETEEYSNFLDLLNLCLDELKDHFKNYPNILDKLKELADKIISYPNNDIKSKASQIYPSITNVAQVVFPQNMANIMKTFLETLIKALVEEKENDVISNILNSITDMFKDKEKILTKAEIDSLFEKLFQIFDKVENNRLVLLKEKDEVQEEVDKLTETTKEGDDEEDSDNEKKEELQHIKDEIEEVENVITSFSDVIGAIFKTHKELSIDITKKMIADVLPKYFNEKSSEFEIKMGLFILDDMVEFLGQELLNEIWDNISQILMKYVSSPICTLRQASSYGLGEFIHHTKNNYNKYSEKILEELGKGMLVQFNADEDSEDEYGQAQDNVITALGKLIKFQHEFYPNIKEIINQWLQHLPIVFDVSESVGMHELMCDLIIKNSEMVFGENNSNLPKIIRILAKIYKSSKLSNKKLDENIKVIIDGIKNNSDLNKFITEAQKDAKKSIQEKIKEYFS